MNLPLNLDLFMSTLYDVVNLDILPFSIPNPFIDNIEFDYPDIYSQFNVSFNYL